MHPNDLFYLLQHSSPPSSPTAPLVFQLLHHVLPAGYPGTYLNQGEYNIDWSAEHQRELLHIANQMSGGLSTSGMATTTNFQCKWLTGAVPCNQGFDNLDDLMEHAARIHDVQGSADRKLVCQWVTDRGCCGKEYRRDGFRRHFCVHVGCKVSCTVCGKPFSRKDSMLAHTKKQHGK